MSYCRLRLSFLWLPVLFLGFSTIAQKAPIHQLTLVNENDNYAFSYTDRYYTNGIMLRYTQAVPAGEAVKRTTTVEAGQMIFTPYTFSLAYRKFMDRPFTGLLYLKALRTVVNTKGQLWQWGAMAGVIGEKAFGREVQRWHHRTWHLKRPYGWNTQLNSGMGFNLEGKFVQPLLSVGLGRWGLQINGSGRAEVGTLAAQAGTGMLLRMGIVGPNRSAAVYDTRLGTDGRQCEWYLFYEPQVAAQWYNATLQGTLGQKTHHYFTTVPAPWVCQQKLGVVYAPTHWTAQLAFTHKSKEAISMHANENWGTVALGYRW